MPSFIDRLRSYFSSTPTPSLRLIQPEPPDTRPRGMTPLGPPVTGGTRDQPPLRGLVGGRVSQENPDQYFTGLETFAIFSTERTYWKEFISNETLSLADFGRLRPDKLIELLADLSPEVSDALWKYLLMCNPGWELHVYRPGTEDPYPEAQAAADEIMKTVGEYCGTQDVFYNRQFMTIALRGSTLAELILADDARTFVDIATPDTRTLRYRRRVDPLRGIVWDFGQWQQGEFVSLDVETIRYAPLHPFPGRIEGRPLFSASFFLSIFLMSVLRDFKRVIQQQGWPRLDVEIDFEKIRDAMPVDAQNNPAEFEKWVNGIVAQVVGVYQKLKPDQTYVHTTVTKVNNPVGAVNTSSLSSMDGLFKALERMAARSLHTMPLLMGITDGVSEANANRQWEIYAKGIESIQHLVENTIGPLIQLALEADGILATVQLRFAQMRAAEALRDAQVEFLKTQTAVIQRNEGFINQDQAAELAAGVKKAASETPVYGMNATIGNPANANPGGAIAGLGTGAQNENRTVTLPLESWQLSEEGRARLLSSVDDMMRAPTFSELKAVKAIWETNAPADAVDLLEATPEASDAAN
jgi:hypothetical protein